MPYYSLQKWTKSIDWTGLRIRIVNADGYVIERFAKQLSFVLQGRDKPIYHPEANYGDAIVVTNCDGLRFEQEHQWHTKFYKWQNQFKRTVEMNASEFWRRYGSTGVLKREVHSALPNDVLRRMRLQKLICYRGPYHDFNEEVLYPWVPPISPWQPSGGRWELPPGFEAMNPDMYVRRLQITEAKSKIVHYVPFNAHPALPKFRPRPYVRPFMPKGRPTPGR